MTHVPSRQAECLQIAVLAGGESSERAISLQSGETVLRVLKRRGHCPTLIDPAERNLRTVPWRRFDAAFIALHGRFGEDGGVQELLEELQVPYTGSNPITSRLAFSKSATKERLIHHGVPTPDYILIHDSDDADRVAREARRLGFPLVVKPDAQGSSLGVSVVDSPEQLPQALARCFSYDSLGLLETAILGSEWTVGLLDDSPLPPIRIATQREFYDYQAKYQDETTEYHFEVDLPKAVVDHIELVGKRACQALGTCGIARVDIRVDRFHHPWVLEVNTIPGLTDHSLIPKAAARAGLDLGQLCEQSIRNCLPAFDGRGNRTIPLAGPKMLNPTLRRQSR